MENLADVLSEVRGTAHDVESAVLSIADGIQRRANEYMQTLQASNEVAITAEQIAKGTAEQAASIAESQGAVTSFDKRIAHLAAEGRSLSQAAQDALTQSELGLQSVESATQAMDEVQEVSESLEGVIGALEERSVSVRDIVKAINAIAEQTNLLALNAAIEAARAGEHGRGFAVVAGAIRKLSEQATASTHSVTAILASVQEDTSRVAAGIHSSSESVNRCREMVNQVSSVIALLNNVVSSAASLAAQLAAQTAEMAGASSAIAGGISSIAMVTNQNAAAAGELKQSLRQIQGTMAPVQEDAARAAQNARDTAAVALEIARRLDEIASMQPV